MLWKMGLNQKHQYNAVQSVDINNFDEVNFMNEIELLRSRRGVPAIIVGGIGLIASSIAIYEFVRVRITSEDSGRTPLHKAAQAGDLVMVKSCIQFENLSPNVQDDYGNTPLHYAAANGKLNIVRFLTKQAHGGFVKNNSGELPLHFAALSGVLPVVRYLIEEANYSIYDQTNDGRTALHLAAIQNHVPVSKYLIPRYNVASLEDKYNNTPLLLAAYIGSLDVVKYFLNEPVDFNLRSSVGRTPLIFAAYGGRINVMKYLIEHKSADVNVKELSTGYTPLHYAALAGRLDTIKYLIEQKHANINLTNKRGQTPLRIAQMAGHFDVAGYIQSRGGRRRRSVGNFSPLINDQFISRNSYPSINFGSVKGMSQINPSAFKPAIDGKYSQPSRTAGIQNTHVNSSLLLLDMIIRNCTGQQYIPTKDYSILEVETHSYATCIIERFKRITEEAALRNGISIHRLNIDFRRAQEEISKNVLNFAEVSRILKLYVNNACPGREAGCPGKLNPKTFKNFITTLNDMLDTPSNLSIKKTLEKHIL